MPDTLHVFGKFDAGSFLKTAMQKKKKKKKKTIGKSALDFCLSISSSSLCTCFAENTMIFSARAARSRFSIFFLEMKIQVSAQEGRVKEKELRIVFITRRYAGIEGEIRSKMCCGCKPLSVNEHRNMGTFRVMVAVFGLLVITMSVFSIVGGLHHWSHGLCRVGSRGQMSGCQKASQLPT